MAPAFVGAGRSVLGAIAAGAFLLVRRVPLPPRSTWPAFALVAVGVGIGFGLLSAIALPSVGVAATGVVTGLLPLGTAVMATLRAGERPASTFWVASAVGTSLVIGFALASGGGRIRPGDILLLVALPLGAIGYAEGGRLSRELPGWQVICWALVFALPISLPVTIVSALRSPPHPGAASLTGFAYISLVSVLLGFFAWYRGLATAGIARASQLQLAQPLLTLVWAAVLLHEHVALGTLGVAAGILACVAATQRARVSRGVRPG